MSSPSCMLEAIDLSKRYDRVTAVESISFQVSEGETLGLVGTSGCGKTTTLKMLNRLVEPTAGMVRIAGQDIRQQKPAILRRHIGYAIQNAGLFPHYTVADNVAAVPRLLKWRPQRIAHRTAELLKLVGLPPETFVQRYPHELSGGQQQRVGIARALAADPPIVLLDEPFGALDQVTREQLQQDFKQLESLLHKTIVLVTHDIFEAVKLCDRICVMDAGRVEQLGTPQELVFSPQTPFVRNFLQSTQFQLELQVTRLQDLLPYLSAQASQVTSAKMLYPTQTSLLEVLESLEFGTADSFGIVEGNCDRTWVVRSDDLLPAFYQFRASFQ